MFCNVKEYKVREGKQISWVKVCIKEYKRKLRVTITEMNLCPMNDRVSPNRRNSRIIFNGQIKVIMKQGIVGMVKKQL